MSQKCCNILVACSTIRQLRIFLLRLWRWWTTLDCEISRSPDTLWALLAGFVSITWSTASKSIHLGLPDLVWYLRFWQPKRNCLNHLATLLWSTSPLSFTLQMSFGYFSGVLVRIRKAAVPELGYATHLSLRLSNHPRSEAMHKVSAHQLPRYYKPQLVPTTAWTALVEWYTHRKLAHTTKILLNFWLTKAINTVSIIGKYL